MAACPKAGARADIETRRGHPSYDNWPLMPDPLQLERIKAPVSEDIDAVNRIIGERLHSNLAFVHELASHIIDSGGKRLRPLLTLLMARACEHTGTTHRLLAATIEFIHTATLLHDDVVDDAGWRRGHETARSIWGNSASVLVGDFLYSRAFQMIVESGLPEATRVFAYATNTIAEGEVRQLLNCRKPSVDEDNYLQIIRCKTATLFEAAARVGAIAANASERMQYDSARFGLNIGIAFQLIDDALDYEADKDTGKPSAKDIGEGKPTMPLIYTLARCSPAERKILEDTLQQRSRDPDDRLTDQAVELVRNSGALDYTRKHAKSYVDRAGTALSTLPDSVYKTALEQLNQFVFSRDY